MPFARSTPFRLFLLLALAAATPACAPMLEHFMVDCPNHAVPQENFGTSSPSVLRFHGVDRQYRIPVGPPDASLLVWVMDPIADANAPASPEPPTPRGTILVLHGYRNEMQWMLGKARALSRAGFRTVLVDLRGHGSSSGEYLTYGVQESADLSQVIDALEERGEIVGPLGAWGISYGGATAILLAARDPRISAVVAVAPYASMRQIVPIFANRFGPLSGLSKSDIDAMITQQGRRLGFDPDQADVAAAAARLHAPLLILHGEWDRLVPPEQSEQVAAAAAEAGVPIRRIVVPGTGHITIFFDATGQVEHESVAWMQRWLADDSARRATTPADHAD